MREKIILICPDCLNRNYTTYKNRYNNPARLKQNKFCPSCNKHTIHKETK